MLVFSRACLVVILASVGCHSITRKDDAGDAEVESDARSDSDITREGDTGDAQVESDIRPDGGFIGEAPNCQNDVIPSGPPDDGGLPPEPLPETQLFRSCGHPLRLVSPGCGNPGGGTLVAGETTTRLSFACMGNLMIERRGNTSFHGFHLNFVPESGCTPMLTIAVIDEGDMPADYGIADLLCPHDRIRNVMVTLETEEGCFVLPEGPSGLLHVDSLEPTTRGFIETTLIDEGNSDRELPVRFDFEVPLGPETMVVSVSTIRDGLCQ